MLRATLITLTCVVMLSACSKEDEDSSALNDSQSNTAPATVSNESKDTEGAPVQAPKSNAASDQSTAQPAARPNVAIPKLVLAEPPPRRVVENFYADFSSGRIDDALKCLTARYIAAEGGSKRIRAAYQLANAMVHSGWHLDVVVKNERLKGQTALVHAMVDNLDGKGARLKTHRLVREDKAWKIDAIDNG